MDERSVAKAAVLAAEEQLQSLCASHAGTFVAVDRRGRAMEDALKSLQVSVKNVRGLVENAQQVMDQEGDKDDSLAVLSEKHRVRRRTLLQHSSLLELLELPSLMDACVRSNLYEEALSIAAFSNILERRHGSLNVVVSKVIAQIRSRQGDLRRHLLHRLKSTVTMPECLEILTALRRLNSIDMERQNEVNLERVHAAMELKLQVEFLEARDVWLESSPNRSSLASSSIGRSEELLDAIERNRTRVFEVATQFNAIFRARTSDSDTSVSLLTMWASRRINSFLALLSVHLASMADSATIRDALEASVFFASSMGRLGADFTGRLPSLFEPKIHSLIVAPWSDGSQQLEETLRVCAEAGVATPLTSHVPETQSPVAPLSLAEPQPAPRKLLATPPLARFVNAALDGLNELRRCLLPGIFESLRISLGKLLDETLAILKANERSVLAPGLRGDANGLRSGAQLLLTAYTSLVDPYLRGSLEAALGNDTQAIHFHRILEENQREPNPEKEPEPTMEPHAGAGGEEAVAGDEPSNLNIEASDGEVLNDKKD